MDVKKYDILEAMEISRRSFFDCLGEKRAKMEDFLKAVENDITYNSSIGSQNSHAFNGSIDYNKAFPKTFKDRDAYIQVSYIVSKLRRFIAKKKIKLKFVLFWEFGKKNGRLHCHGICTGFFAELTRLASWWSRNIGNTRQKTIWSHQWHQEYAQKDLGKNGMLPSLFL